MEAIGDVLEEALSGENSCISCGGLVPVASGTVDFMRALLARGALLNVEPEGVRVLLLLGSVDAGCGVSASPGDPRRMRASCPACATPAELERASRLGGLGLRPAAR